MRATVWPLLGLSTFIWVLEIVTVRVICAAKVPVTVLRAQTVNVNAPIADGLSCALKPVLLKLDGRLNAA